MPRIRSFRWESLAERAYSEWRRANPGAVAVDTETTGRGYFDPAFSGTLSWGHNPHYFEFGCGLAREVFSEIVLSTDTWIFHNAKFDLHKLVNGGLFQRRHIDQHSIEDTEALAHLLDEHQLKGLKVLAKKYLGVETNEDTALRKARQKLKLRKADGYDKLPREVIIPYALKDAEFTWNLWTLLRPQVEVHADLFALYRQEMDLTLVLLDIEAAGLGVDVDFLRQQVRLHGDAAATLEAKISMLVGKPIGKKVDKGEFNPGSWQQILAAFEERGHTLPGTSDGILSQVPDDLAVALREYRSVQKLRSTYLIPMMEEQRDGVLHPNFRQHRTKTGRMASGADND